MPYIGDMLARATQSFDLLHSDVDVVVFADFPDYANVGDSAIALGQASYWALRGIAVSETFSAAVLPDRVYASETPVFISGGGNLGGLYPEHCEHRYRLAERLDPRSLLIQGPQSVHFVNEAARAEFARRMGHRANMRIAVRDRISFESLRGYVDDLILSPDAVHFLGEIPSPEPVQREVRLCRTDAERAWRAAPAPADWRPDGISLAASQWLTRRVGRVTPLRAAFRQPNEWWMRKAEKRFARGVRQLARGETIVTDRLHAMLIGLQMGRQVVAHDNSYGKLSRYISTWFGDSPPANLSWVTP